MFKGRNILVATDFSPCSEAAVAHAFAIADKFDGQVHLVHVFTLQEIPETTMMRAGRMSDVEAQVAHKLADIAATWRESGRVGEVSVMVGDPVSTISKLAEERDCDLVVVGTHGRRGFERLHVGSVAAGLVRSAPCPVLVVREPRRSA